LLIGAEELVAPGGPSAPVWAFFSALSLALIGVLAQQLKARSDLKQLKATSERVESEAIQAHESAATAQSNTQNVSNGFARRVDTKLDNIQSSINDTNNALRKTEEALRAHIEWHLREESKDNG
jgi:hypothetical protein